MAEVLLDSFIDSLKILAVVAAFTFIIAFLEPFFENKVKLKGKLAPLIGVSVSLLPQCGFSVVAADLYQKRHITVGTLIGVFIATSDEALPVFLSYPDKALHVLPLLGFKFVLGLFFGYLIDFIFVKSRKAVSHHVEHCNEQYQIKLMHCDGAERIESTSEKCGCSCEECAQSECAHLHHIHHSEINGDNKKTGILNEYKSRFDSSKKKAEKIKRYLWAPLSHSLEIFIYVFIINVIFGTIIFFVGQDKIIDFLLQNKYIAPLVSVVIGAIPNCASSIILSELYIMGGLGFGAALGGLCMNAGIAFMVLFKDIKHIKRNLLVFLSMLAISLFIGYIFSLAFSFDTLSF